MLHIFFDHHCLVYTLIMYIVNFFFPFIFKFHSCLVSCLCTAAAAAKSLQSCLTLCDPIDGSPPGSPFPGILQARILEWVAISFSNAWKWKVKGKSLSRPTLRDPMDCSLPGPSVHGILQARVLEWGAIAFFLYYCVAKSSSHLLSILITDRFKLLAIFFRAFLLLSSSHFSLFSYTDIYIYIYIVFFLFV